VVSNGLSVSTDGGRYWSETGQVNPNGAMSQFDVLSATECWVLAPGSGLWRTANGITWHQLGSVGPM
jgi:hypothetical protein